jgi:hypothetical protein
MPANLGKKYKSKNSLVTYSTGGLIPYVNNEGVTVPGMYKTGGSFPDMNKDGKITQADIFLKKKEKGTIK